MLFRKPTNQIPAYDFANCASRLINIMFADLSLGSPAILIGECVVMCVCVWRTRLPPFVHIHLIEHRICVHESFLNDCDEVSRARAQNRITLPLRPTKKFSLELIRVADMLRLGARL